MSPFKLFRRSKDQLQGELDLSRRSSSACNFSRIRNTIPKAIEKIRDRNTKVGTIEQIVELCSKLQQGVLAHWKRRVLRQCKVEISSSDWYCRFPVDDRFHSPTQSLDDRSLRRFVCIGSWTEAA